MVPIFLGCGKLSFRKYCVMHGGQIVLDDSVTIKLRLCMCNLLHLGFFHHWRRVSKCPEPASASAAGSQCIRFHSLFLSPVWNDS
jgi:hypothetical protein